MVFMLIGISGLMFNSLPSHEAGFGAKQHFAPRNALVGNTLHVFILTCENHPPIPAKYFYFFAERRLTRAMQAIGRLFKPGMNRCR
jgi:hypothetical protein